ncbi:MAG: 50S ribosomal protein L18 [Candidatus Poribacteria bacterium]
MSSKVDKKKARIKRHNRVRKNVHGTSERPRLSVFKSSNHIYAQIVDDISCTTLLTVSTLSPDVRENAKNGGNIESAKLVGETIGKKALDSNISKVVFDRGGYLYHGRVKALADAAREAGLTF